MTMRRTSGQKNKLFLRPRNQKRSNKKLVSVTSVANELAGVQYHNDSENQQAIKAGKKAHLTHTLFNDVIVLLMFVILLTSFALVLIAR